jgi:hypothetical protein
LLKILKTILKKSFLGPILGRLKSTQAKFVNFKIRYDQDEIITSHYPYFQEDKKFIEALSYNLSFNKNQKNVIKHDWRIYILCSFAFNAIKNGDGDLIECGVFRGDCAKTILHYCDLNSTNKNFYLLDSFDGFDQSQLTIKEKNLRKESQFRGVLEFVKKKFIGDNCIKIIEGFVPNTFSEVKSKKFCFAHIDMNASYPEKEALEFIFPRLKDGGVIIFDDYGHAGHEEQRVALDYVAKKLHRVITCLPTGQGLLIK